MIRAIDPGAYDRQITIESVTESRSASGEVAESWATFATEWAKFRPMTGREYFRFGVQAAEFDTLFTIPWRGDITRKMRVSFDGAVYNIRDTREVGYKVELEIMAQVVRV